MSHLGLPGCASDTRLESGELLVPSSDGLQPTFDGLHLITSLLPSSDGLQPSSFLSLVSSNGLQPNSVLVTAWNIQE